ncbi:MFS transporter [Streptomyces spiralis]|uniref:MFS transporter n=1 Tax=Streptomyces spiralis TaxID=66376 RepID=UPI0033E5FFC6
MCSTQRRDHRPIFAVLVAATLAYTVQQSLVAPALPTLQRELHTTQPAVTYLFTAFLLTSSVATPILGRLADVHGKRRMLLAMLTALAIGSAISAGASDIGTMILGRAVQGIGGAVLPVCFGIVRDEMPPRKVPGAVGVLSAMLAAGGALGIVLAGPVMAFWSYHALFWLPLPVDLAVLAAAALLVPESPHAEGGRVGWRPAVLLAGWLAALSLGVGNGSSAGWTSAPELALFAAAVALAAAWVRSELTSSSPLVDMGTMRSPVVWRANLVALLVGMGMYGMNVLVPGFLQTPRSAGYGFGASVAHCGVLMLPITAAVFTAGMLTGRLEGRFGSRSSLLTGTAVMAAGLALLALWPHGLGQFTLGMVVCGAGQGLSFAALSNVVLAAVPAERTGVVMGANTNIRNIGGVFGSQLVAALLAGAAEAGAPPPERGYAVAFGVLAGALVAAASMTALLPRDRKSGPGEPSARPPGARLPQAPAEEQVD